MQLNWFRYTVYIALKALLVMVGEETAIEVL